MSGKKESKCSFSPGSHCVMFSLNFLKVLRRGAVGVAD